MKKIIALFAVGGIGAGLIYLLRARTSRRTVQELAERMHTVRAQATSRLPFGNRQPEREPATIWAGATLGTLDASTPDLDDMLVEHPQPSRGADSLSDFSRLAAEPADEWIERLPDDE